MLLCFVGPFESWKWHGLPPCCPPNVKSSDLPEIFLLQFAPDTWSSLTKLLHFVGPPLPNDSNVRVGLRDCASHLEKAEVLWRVAQRVRPEMLRDKEELERFGGTSGQNSMEFAAVCEAIVCEFYSAIDGLRTFLFGVHRKVKGVQNGSNGKLFERAENGGYGEDFPEEISVLLASSMPAWFSDLRTLRTELTHGSTGSCHLNGDGVLYMNQGITRDGKALFIEDIEQKLRHYDLGLRGLVEAVANHYLGLLLPEPQFKMCGTFKARWYGRMAAVAPTMTRGDGQCLSWDWFEKEEGLFCPLASACPAYERKWPGGSAAIFGGT